jgi:rhodanese-related sulfurtransferase
MKKTLGILVCTLLIAIAFVPISNSMSVGNTSFFEGSTELDVEVTWEKWWMDGEWYVDFICDSSEPLDRLEMYINDELVEVIEDPVPKPWMYTIRWANEMRFYTFKFIFYGLGGETAEVIIKGSDLFTSDQQTSQQATSPSGIPSTFEIIWITLEEAWDMLTDTGNDIQHPIDIRTDKDWNDGFIDTPYPEHAVHFSKAKLETPDGLAEFIETYEDKEIILYSNSNEGYTWLLYQSILMDAGYSGTVYAWEGGYDAWMDAGYPIRTNTEPDPPTITGPVRGKPGVEYEYVFSTEDPENDAVSYYVDWGDDTSTGWTDYYPSGEEVAISHTWEEINWYNTIRCKSKDVYGVESDWSESLVPINNAPWRFLEQFPMLEAILLKILNINI